MSPEENTHTNRHTDRHTITKGFSCFSPEERVNSAGQGSVHLILKGIPLSLRGGELTSIFRCSRDWFWKGIKKVMTSPTGTGLLFIIAALCFSRECICG